LLDFGNAADEVERSPPNELIIARALGRRNLVISPALFQQFIDVPNLLHATDTSDHDVDKLRWRGRIGRGILFFRLSPAGRPPRDCAADSEYGAKGEQQPAPPALILPEHEAYPPESRYPVCRIDLCILE